jgi:PAS domain S-box-containing protein
MANPAAGALWRIPARELVGESIAGLFVFEVVSRDPELLQAQWDALLVTAVENPVTLKLQPREAAAFDVTMRIDRATEDPVRYFALVSIPAPSPVAAPSAAPPAAEAAPPPVANDALALLAEHSPLGFFDLNFFTKEVHYSPVWKRLLGYTRQELPDTLDTWKQLLHPEDSAAAPDHHGKVTTAGPRPFAVEFRMKHARGHYVWIHSVGVQLFGPDGVLQRVLGAHLDIQDRKEFEESALRSEERLAMLGDRCGLGMFDLDFAADQYWFSPSWKRLIGYKDADLGNDADTLAIGLPREDIPSGAKAYFLAKDPAQPAYLETIRLRHREGRDLPVLAGIFRQFSRRKELQRVVGFMKELPADTAAAAPAPAPREGASSDVFAALAAEMHEGVLVADAAGRVIFINAKAEQILGRPADQVTGQQVADVFPLKHRLSHQPGESPVDKVLASGESVGLNDEFSLDTGGGRTVPIAWSCRPVPDGAGRATGAVLVFRNPDEMTLTRDELVRANRFEGLGLLAAGIAHDYNNLLTTILGGVSVAKDCRTIDTAKSYAHLEKAETACETAKGLSKQLLSVAKGGTSVRQVVAVADVLKDAKLIAKAGTNVVVHDPEVAPDIQPICVDRAQILQVFQNLIVNAIQAMPPAGGNIWITAANVPLQDGQVEGLTAGNYVQVDVRDDGSGIKPEILQKIWEPFFTTKKTGTGLGLATVQSIVKRHGGIIGVDSTVGAGTTFSLVFPPADRPVEAVPRKRPQIHEGDQRILFMDDDKEICEFTATMLTDLGYKFDVVHTGDEAVKLYRRRFVEFRQPYAVVLMDLTIVGGMGGEETFKHLREIDPDVVAVIASGYDNEDMKRQFLEAGFAGYLTKPYRRNELGNMIKTVLGR